MHQTLLIIPTYNERENIAVLVAQIRSICPKVHLLFVDDSSPDGTAKEIKRIQKENPKQIFLEVRKKKEGLGKAYIHGFQWALSKNYQNIFEMDADLSHPPEALPKMISLLNNTFDVVIGSRYLDGGRVVNWPASRVFLSKVASLYVRIFTGLPINDATAGYIGYTRLALASIDFKKISFVGYAFQIEMKYKLWQKDFRIKEVPIVFTNREKGHSKMNSSIIWEAIYGVIYLKFKSIFNRL